MVTTASVLGIAAVALGLVLTPGPNMIYLVSHSVTQGRTAGFVSLLGVAAGFLLHLAWQALRPGGGSVLSVRELPDDAPRRLFLMGCSPNLLNPKIAVLYVSLLP